MFYIMSSGIRLFVLDRSSRSSQISQRNMCVVLLFSAGEDYTLMSETEQPVLNAATSRVCFRIAIVDDNIYEAAEVFSVELYTNNTGVEISPDSATVTILDDDCMLTLYCQRGLL